MPLNTSRFDAAEYIQTPEDVAFFLEAAFQEPDAGHIAHALGIVARSQGMAALAEKTGLSRQALYKSLCEDGNPTLDTVIRLMGALGLHLTVRTPEHA